jgi:hypothetical protein
MAQANRHMPGSASSEMPIGLSPKSVLLMLTLYSRTPHIRCWAKANDSERLVGKNHSFFKIIISSLF